MLIVPARFPVGAASITEHQEKKPIDRAFRGAFADFNSLCKDNFSL